MDESTCFTNQFLIAMPGMADANFFRTVTYVCEHNASGALGIVINRPLGLSLPDLLGHLEIEPNGAGVGTMPVYSGGPVHPEQGFVIHRPLGRWESTLKVTDSIGVTTSRDVLQALAQGQGPAEVLVALGYAGWGEGQLEREMAENAWLSGPADDAILFRAPVESRWTAAAALIGVDLGLIAGHSGRA